MTDQTTPDAETPENQFNPESPEQTPEQELEALDLLQSDLAKFRDLALRSQADLDNYRKRAAREKEDALRFANANLLEKLLPVIDSFDLGLNAAKGEGETSPVFQGMSMVRKQMEDFLSEAGLQAVDAVGQAFDPNKHEAIGQEASEDVPEGHVIRQLRRGYILRDRLLRPASVFLSTGPTAE